MSDWLQTAQLTAGGGQTQPVARLFGTLGWLPEPCSGKTIFVKTSPPPILLWLALAAAALLLSPYLGVHILSSPPAAHESDEVPANSDSPSSDLENSGSADYPAVEEAAEPLPSNPSDLEQLRGLLAE